jgi:hypothetical protein
MAIDFPSSPTNGQTYTSGGTTWVYDSSVPAWNLQNTVISGPTGPTGPTGPAGTAFVGYDYEIHVSVVDGSDSTGNGDLLNPVATITKAITLVAGNRNVIVVHPGTYTESPTLAAKVLLKAADGPTYNEGPFISGTLTIPTAAGTTQVVGLSIATVEVTGTGAPTFTNCNLTTAFNKSSTGTVVISGGTVSALNVTAAGLTRVVDMQQASSTINNHASSTITFVNVKVMLNTTNTLGNMFVSNCAMFGTGTYALTSAAGSVQLSNSSALNLAGSAQFPISLTNTFYSINNCSIAYSTSVFSGSTDLNPTVTSTTISATKLITRNGNSMQYLKGDGSLESLTPVTKTGDFTVAATESYLINNKSGSACVVTLPSAATFVGRKLVFTNYQAQTIDSASSNVVPIAGGSPGTAIVGGTAGNWAAIISDGTNWLIVERG